MIKKQIVLNQLKSIPHGDNLLNKNLTNDRDFLREEQYKQADNLRARITLHERFSTNPTNWYTWLFDHYPFPPDARILEIGCGPGNVWEHNRDRIPRNWQLTLSDLSEGMLASASKKTGDLDVRLCCVDADALSFPKDCFEGLIGNHMLYHVPDKQRTLAEIQRVLTPDGMLITATNGEGHLYELYKIIKGFDPFYQYVNQTISFTLENGKELLSNYFDQVERIDFPDSLKITEASPLVEYTLSLWSINQEYFRENLSEYQSYIQNLLDSNGYIEINKSVGVLISRQPKAR
jgi:ubiquinone/menaquinone biosynthesis C-methylase UbiE